MIAYRVVDEAEYNFYSKNERSYHFKKKEYNYGHNTFKYDEDKNYFHYFLYAEEAQAYLDTQVINGHGVIRVNLPNEICENGFGEYVVNYDSQQGPTMIEAILPGIRIESRFFDTNMILDYNDQILDRWVTDEGFTPVPGTDILNKYDLYLEFFIALSQNLKNKNDILNYLRKSYLTEALAEFKKFLIYYQNQTVMKKTYRN